VIALKKRNLVGKRVSIIDKESQFYGHWGYVVRQDDHYHVGGGSICLEDDLRIVPIFDRDQFVVARKQ
jgi:hypothetical protein